jgi:hypothetical protein
MKIVSNRKLVDLHVHSNVSDGTLSPKEVVRHASEVGVAVMALTDHDTVAGVAEAKEAAEKYGVVLIPGIEISAGFKNRDIHILGYFVDTESKEFNDILNAAWVKREERNVKIAEKFKNFGITLDLDAIKKISGSEVITRAHFARWLVENGYCRSNSEVFEKYIGNDGPCYVPRDYMTRETAVKSIISAGGVPVLAHPMLYGLNSCEVDMLVGELKEMGLKGIETYYSSNMGMDEEIVRRLANKYDLIMTGGSDYHGDNKPGLEIGTGRSESLHVPMKAAHDLFEAAERKIPEIIR